MNITALIENTCSPAQADLNVEPGLSLWVETKKHRILFDSGVSGAFLQNAHKLGVDISKADLAVISHHHYDHAGGLRAFFEVNSSAPVWLGKSASEDLRLNAYELLKKPIGMDEQLFSEFPARFRFSDDFAEIAADIFLLPRVPHNHALPRGNRFLYRFINGKRQHDTFEHELVMVVRQAGGIVVFSGCSHNGILNVLDGVLEHFTDQRILALIGGFHLIGIPFLNTLAGSPAQIRALGNKILQYPVDKVYTCHCTGLKAYKHLKDAMGEKLDYLAAGSRLEI